MSSLRAALGRRHHDSKRGPMHSSLTASSGGSRNTTTSQLPHPSRKAWIPLRVIRTLILFWPALFIPASCTPVIKSSAVLPAVLPAYGSTPINVSSVEQNVQYETSLIQDNLPDYLDFVGSNVLPVMSKNIDEIVHNLKGLTEIKPGLFYHGHIDYSTSVSGGINGLMDMNNVILQYHTLENPLIYIPYWKEELWKTGDWNINAWLDRVNEYNRAIGTPSTASEAQYVPLTESEAVQIASKWDDYLRQNRLASPGPEMLINMVYLIDGGKQPRYQEAFRNIYRFHSIAFLPEGYVQLDNRTHLEHTFSPFQIDFVSMGECRELVPLFDEATAAGFGYILNLKNPYSAQWPDLRHDPDMAKLNMKLNIAISNLPDGNLIKINDTPDNQQIAFFAVGNYIFVVYGSLDSPPLF